MAIPCKEEQQRQAAQKMCNRMRSVLTLFGEGSGTTQYQYSSAFQLAISGQLRFLGLSVIPRHIEEGCRLYTTIRL